MRLKCSAVAFPAMHILALSTLEIFWFEGRTCVVSRDIQSLVQQFKSLVNDLEHIGDSVLWCC